MNWHEFEDAAPKLAELGRRRFEATHVALLGTIRKDGSPRITPVEPYLVLDHLLLGMLTASHKALDLSRDPRCTLHSSVSDVNGAEGEFKLDGRAVLVTDPALLHGDYEAWWTVQDASPSLVFSVDIASAAHIAWDINRGEMTVKRWSPESGLVSTVQGY
jgi:predicted pyridoxine 5'-phosphate oxidase superfamily flavin-nucleotide-binding protein